MAGTATKFGIRAMRSNLSNAWKNDRRRLLKGITAWVLFSGIIIVFAFMTQTPHQAGVSAGGTAATVNGQIVSQAELSEQVEMMSRDKKFAQLEQFGGDFARQMVRKQAIGVLVDQRLLGQNLGKQGLMAPDAQVRDAIAEIPAFQEDGRFSKTRYLGYLQQSGQSAAEFEEKVRRQLATMRAGRTFSLALRPLPFESDLVKAVEGKQVNVEGVSIPTESLVFPDGVSQAEVKGFLAKSDAEARVKTYFDSHKSEFSQPEKAKVRHILIRADKTKPEAIEKAKLEAEKILAAVKAGGDFAKIAAEKSQDPGSKSNGGLIDFFPRGAMVPEFEAFAFSAQPGAVSDLVKTDFGFHIIKVEGRKAAEDNKLEEVREDIAQILVAQEQSREQIAALEKAVAAGQAAEVQAFMTKNKLSWRESGPFSLSAETIPQFGGGNEAVSMAFKLSPEKPLATKLVHQGPQAILLRYKAVGSMAKPSKTATADAGKAAADSPELKLEEEASRRTEQAFSSWMDVLRKDAKISINPEVVKTSDAGDQ